MSPNNPYQYTRIYNQTRPTEGPKCIPITHDFSVALQNPFHIDLTQNEVQTRFGMVQTIFVDLSGSDNTITFTIEGTNQRIVAKGRTQGYYPVLAPNPTKIDVKSSANTDVVPMTLINVPVAGVVWPTQ